MEFEEQFSPVLRCAYEIFPSRNFECHDPWAPMERVPRCDLGRCPMAIGSPDGLDSPGKKV